MIDVHGRWLYTLFVQLRDHRGNELITSLSGKEVCILPNRCEIETDKAPLQCVSVRDVDATDLRSDPSALDNLLVAVDPILGNLKEVHECWSRNEGRDVETPLMVFTIESWAVCEEKAFGLLEYTPV